MKHLVDDNEEATTEESGELVKKNSNDQTESSNNSKFKQNLRPSLMGPASLSENLRVPFPNFCPTPVDPLFFLKYGNFLVKKFVPFWITHDTILQGISGK